MIAAWEWITCCWEMLADLAAAVRARMRRPRCPRCRRKAERLDGPVCEPCRVDIVEWNCT